MTKRDRIDEILSTIDAGLQSTAEASYGETPWDGARPADSARLCIRCDDTVDTEGDVERDICGACRRFILGDTDTDPAEHRQRWAPAGAGFLTYDYEIDRDGTVREGARQIAEFGVDHETFVATLNERYAAVGQAMTDLAEALVEALRPVAVLLGIIDNETDPLDDAEIARIRQAVLDFDPGTLIEDHVIDDDLAEGDEITIDDVPWIVLERLPDDPSGTPCYRLGPPPDEFTP